MAKTQLDQDTINALTPKDTPIEGGPDPQPATPHPMVADDDRPLPWVPGVIGAERVRLSFNPSDHGGVAHIKGLTADLIDYCERLKTCGEQARCAALAQTKYEEAAMWAVKAATYVPPSEQK